ncbi:unnamed protein product [Caenorhabditis auriculariae]|uniref:Uncharacterized protein n=1 Tax=Caenorhabditis auriculariae TaxID=2777116 RepID=A0A8S1HT74_9PELO|nr:unnamed protein product [Caenorhabditis auriculariae]
MSEVFGRCGGFPDRSLYFNLMAIFGWICMPLSIICAYCIIKKSPPAMKMYRLSLLNILFWSTAFCWMMGFGARPVFFLPYFGGFATGFLRSMGLSTRFLAQATTGFLGGVGASVVTVFGYQHQSFIPHSHAMKLGKRTKTWPTIACDFWGPEYYYISDKELGLVHVYFLCLTCSSFVLTIPLAYHSFTLISTYAVSEATRRARKNYIRQLLLMVFLPVVLGVFPILFFQTGYVLLDQKNERMSYCFVVLSSHGPCTALLIMVVHPPYRTVLIKVFRFNGKKEGIYEAQVGNFLKIPCRNALSHDLLFNNIAKK